MLREQALQRQYQEKIATSAEVCDHTALTTPYKFERRSNDGTNTTIVFYSYDIKYHDNSEKKDCFIAADDNLKTVHRDWVDQIEVIGNIRLFNLDDLEADREYLSSAKVIIPDRPDNVISYMDEVYMDLEKAGGHGLYPNTGMEVVISKRYNPKSPYGRKVVGHELGHAVIGMEHPHATGRSPGEHGFNLSGDCDNMDNTIMSYKYEHPISGLPYDHYFETYRGFDIDDIENKYGMSLKGVDYREYKRNRDFEYIKNMMSGVSFLHSLYTYGNDKFIEYIANTFTQPQLDELFLSLEDMKSQYQEKGNYTPLVNGIDKISSTIKDKLTLELIEAKEKSEVERKKEHEFKLAKYKLLNTEIEITDEINDLINLDPGFDKVAEIYFELCGRDRKLSAEQIKHIQDYLITKNNDLYNQGVNEFLSNVTPFSGNLENYCRYFGKDVIYKTIASKIDEETIAKFLKSKEKDNIVDQLTEPIQHLILINSINKTSVRDELLIGVLNKVIDNSDYDKKFVKKLKGFLDKDHFEIVRDKKKIFVQRVNSGASTIDHETLEEARGLVWNESEISFDNFPNQPMRTGRFIS